MYLLCAVGGAVRGARCAVRFGRAVGGGRCAVRGARCALGGRWAVRGGRWVVCMARVAVPEPNGSVE